MQYQKEEIRAAILESAVAEFLEKGYEKASLRSVCAGADTSIGNLYRYFPSREALFDTIVGELHEKLMRLIRETQLGADAFDLPQIAGSVANLFFESYQNNASRFLILIDKSKGSKFEGMREAFFSLIKERVCSELKLTGELCDFAGDMIAGSVLNSICDIVRRGKSPDESRKMLESVLIFYFDGIEDRIAKFYR